MSAPSAAAASLASPLAHVPVPLFASVMGIAGLGLAWRRAHETLGQPQLIGEALLALAAFLFVAVAALYLTKLARHPKSVTGEWTHPIRAAFFPTISIGLLLLASGLYPYAPEAAGHLWLFATLAHLALTVRTVSRWVRHKHDIAHLNPAWFIPVVGNVIVPLLGVKLGQHDLSWLAFGIGIVFWPLLFALVLYRVIFHDDLPPKLQPTLFILLAPPAIAFQSWLALTGGLIDPLAHILFALTVFLMLVLASLLPRLAATPFAVSWWAYTFPLDAAALAMLTYAALRPGDVSTAAAITVLAIATATAALVLVRTLRAALAGHLFVPD